MKSNTAIDLIARQDWLGRAADVAQPAVTHVFEAAGAPGRKVKAFLHGGWLGHPLHTALTDIPLGAWTVSTAVDLLTELGGRNDRSRAAETAVAVGLAGAIGSAVTGLTDWSSTGGRARRIGLAHGLLNATATAFYCGSYWLRRRKRQKEGRNLAYLGYAISMASAYLGGHLVFREGVGVDCPADGAK
jgi:uncharacterized membrane protein